MYAKIKNDAVVKFPYGFDELQAEFSSTLTGEISVPSRFVASQAYADGYRVVPVALEPKPLAHSPGELHFLRPVPELVEGAWVQRWAVQDVPYPTDGKQYVWNPRTRSWDEV